MECAKVESKIWTEKLSAINFIGHAFVDVRSFNTTPEIQYSVFGNKFVQLQERHPEDSGAGDSAPKRVWLLESEDLNGYLTERALTMIEKSKDIPESLFKRFLARVSGVTSQNILAKLAKDGPAVEEAVLDPDLLAFEPQAADDLEILGEIGFVQEGDDHKFRITTEGTQFLHTIKGEVR